MAKPRAKMRTTEAKTPLSENSRTGDKIAFAMHFVLFVAAIMISIFTNLYYFLAFPFIIYGLWAALRRRVWIPSAFSRRMPVENNANTLQRQRKEALIVGAWFIFIGLMMLFVLMTFF